RTCLLETRSHVPERLADRVDDLSGPAEPQNVLEDTIETLSQALQTLPKRRNGRSPQSTDVPVQPSPKVLLDDPTHKLKFRAEPPDGHRSLTRVRGELLQGGFQLIGSGSADGIPHALEASHKHTDRSGRCAQETRQQIQRRYSVGQPR